MLYRFDYKAFKVYDIIVADILFIYCHDKLCLCTVIMGSSRDIGNGDRVQIISLKRIGN